MTPTDFWQLVFWISAAMLGWTLAGYPLLLAARVRFRPRPWQPAHGASLPRVSVMVAAYNEERCIEGKLESVLAADYPHDLVEVIVASDGSDDRTEQLVQRTIDRHPDRAVRLLSMPRAGKAAALNTAVPTAGGDVLVFTDANSIFAADTLRQLVAPLADPRVGGVAGDQRYQPAPTPAAAAGEGERKYWSIDRWLKRMESAAGNTISATGALYAIRRGLFRGVPEGVTDDFAISTDVINQGARLVFCGEAAALEPVAGSSRLEFGRKVRVMTRGFRAVWLRRGLLNPFRHGFYSVQLLSHKLLRRLLIFPLAAMLLASCMLWSFHAGYRVAAIVQLACYALAAASPALGHRVKVARLPFFFCMVNVAAGVALLRTLFGARVVVWDTHRESPALVERQSTTDGVS